MELTTGPYRCYILNYDDRISEWLNDFPKRLVLVIIDSSLIQQILWAFYVSSTVVNVCDIPERRRFCPQVALLSSRGR